MVAAAVFGLADWATKTYEINRLLDRVEASEAAMIRYQDRVGAVQLPDDPDPADRDRAEQELMTAASEGRTEVEDAGEQVASVSFLPWHGELVAAQGAYLAHNRAWVDHLGRGAEDVSVLLGDDPLIDSTWATAEVRMRAAQPWPTWPTIQQRVDAIFAPPAEESDSPGLAT